MKLTKEGIDILLNCVLTQHDNGIKNKTFSIIG